MVGFRTPSGQLTTLQSFDTLRIPRMVRDKPGSWDPQICLDWGKRFVDYLRANVTSTAPTDPRPQVWRAKFIPHTGVRLTLLEATNVDEVVNGEDRFGFLPSWFLDEYRMITLPNSSESSLPVPVSPSNLT